MRWHEDINRDFAFNFPVSIPKRVSDALARQYLYAQAFREKFQSLRGFPMRWHLSIRHSPYCHRLFQSLRGFPMRWHLVAFWR